VSCREIVADGRRWRFCPGDPPDFLQRLQAVVDLEVIDELTGAPPAAPVALATRRAGLAPRVGRDGRLGLVGQPAQLFPPAQVAGSTVAIEVTVPGYLRHALTVTLQAPPQPTVRVALHREPVALWGRVLAAAAAPVAGASVALVDFAPRARQPITNLPLEHLLVLAQGLYAARAASGPPAASVRRRGLTAADSYVLLGGAGAGTTALRLSGRQGLSMPPNPAVPDILLIEPGEPERLEVVRVRALEGALAADQPATATLAHPLRRDHPEGTAVRRAVAAAAGPDVALTRPAIAGDVALLVADAASFAGADLIEVETPGGDPPAEHQLLLTPVATTDAAGRFRLPAVHRLETLTLAITAPGPVTVQRTIDLAATGPVQLVEIRLP
jgi:hypothetical protein